jgi:hypothetical protein
VHGVERERKREENQWSRMRDREVSTCEDRKIIRKGKGRVRERERERDSRI